MSANKSHTITNHEKIREWVEERGGKPARAKGTGSDEDAGLLRIDFPGGDEESLEEISWDDFFEKFEDEQLAFVYQEEKTTGETSYFNKLVNR